MLQHLIIQFPPYDLSSGRLGRLKTKDIFKRLALEVVAVAYERWSLTRGSKYSDLTGKFLVFWKTGR